MSSVHLDAEPHTVYIAWEDDHCLYVGCSVDVEARLHDHHRRPAPWASRVTHIDLFEFPNKRLALDVEWRTVYELQAEFNIRGRDCAYPKLPGGRLEAYRDRQRALNTA